ncbi:MAG: hypothetical protein GWO79_00380 [Actinobacteria bacterium]|nr:hypothetical protein [Actinomycetota bacterium]
MSQTTKKYITVNKTILFGILVFFITVIFYYSQASADTITSSSATVSVGQDEDFSFTLSIDAVSDFFGIGFKLNYDTALLSYQSSTEGNLLSQGCSTSFLTVEDPVGTVNVGLTRLGSDCGTVSGPGEIATFNFKSLNQDGTDTITFSDTALSIASGTDLILPFPTGTWNTISVTVAAPASPVCGDGTCDGNESCSSCSSDCGTCTTTPPPNNGGGGGGGGGTSTPPPTDTTDIISPTQPNNCQAEPADGQVVLSWTNPADSDFNGVLVIRKEGVAPTSKDDGVVVYQGAAEKYTDINVDNGVTYHYGIFAYDEDDNYSEVLTVSAQPKEDEPSETITAKPCPVDITNFYGAEKEVVECVSRREAQEIYNRDEYTSLDDVTLPIYEKIIRSNEEDISQQVKYSIAAFIHYGTSATKILGAGERAGVVNSYRSVFNKFPRTESGWQDVIKIANGRWPDERNEQAEEATKNEIFKKIYLRDPDMDNPNDDAAVTVITYGLRPANRNMDSEKAGINIFKAIYGYNPESAVDWDIVRAIAYSGATR